MGIYIAQTYLWAVAYGTNIERKDRNTNIPKEVKVMFLHSDQSKISQEEQLPPENVIGKHYPDKPIYFFAN
jgi:hypothetical protein